MGHWLVIVGSLLALLALPCILALVVFVDVAYDRGERFVSAVFSRWRAHRRAHQLERRTGIDPGLRQRLLRWPELLRWHEDPTAKPAGPPFEELAADLRRLARQRIEVGHRSPVWFNAVHRAYDDRLVLVCRELEIPERLAGLDGLDRELERLRVESALDAAGLHLPTVDTDHRQGSQ